MKKSRKVKPKIVSYTLEELQKLSKNPNFSKTDWAKVDAMTDDDIDYSDIPEMDEEFFKKVKIYRFSDLKKPISIRLDDDVLTWFKKQKGRYQQHINAVLRAYMDTQKIKRARPKKRVVK